MGGSVVRFGGVGGYGIGYQLTFEDGRAFAFGMFKV